MRKKIKVLIVDDERGLVRCLSQYLRLCGYDTITAYNGREAIQKIDESMPDVILTDLKMPDIDGDSVVEYVKLFAEHSKCIVITAYVDPIIAKRLKKKGAEEVVYKPIMPLKKLDDLIKSVIKNK